MNVYYTYIRYMQFNYTYVRYMQLQLIEEQLIEVGSGGGLQALDLK
jgi:hypothetical protein